MRACISTILASLFSLFRTGITIATRKPLRFSFAMVISCGVDVADMGGSIAAFSIFIENHNLKLEMFYQKVMTILTDTYLLGRMARLGRFV